MDRRTYLVLTGAAAGTAALSGVSPGRVGATDSNLRYGYGGVPILVPVESTTTDEVEPNDACATADAIASNAAVAGSLEPAGVDWYSIDLAAGDEVDVVFDRVSETGVTGVVAYGPGCAFQTLRQVGTPREIAVTVTAETTGTHYVEIVDVEEGDGDYSMLIEPTDAVTSPTEVDPEEYGEQAYGQYGYGGIPA